MKESATAILMAAFVASYQEMIFTPMITLMVQKLLVTYFCRRQYQGVERISGTYLSRKLVSSGTRTQAASFQRVLSSYYLSVILNLEVISVLGKINQSWKVVKLVFTPFSVVIEYILDFNSQMSSQTIFLMSLFYYYYDLHWHRLERPLKSVVSCRRMNENTTSSFCYMLMTKGEEHCIFTFTFLSYPIKCWKFPGQIFLVECLITEALYSQLWLELSGLLNFSILYQDIKLTLYEISY